MIYDANDRCQNVPTAPDLKTTTVYKHTPGPWRVQRAHRADCAYIMPANDELDRIAGTHGDQISPAEHDANAALIASAPDILAQRDQLRDQLRTALRNIVECPDTGTMTMDARAATGIAANIRQIVVATVAFDLWRREGKADAMRSEYEQSVKQAEDQIANWLQQPMTWR